MFIDSSEVKMDMASPACRRLKDPGAFGVHQARSESQSQDCGLPWPSIAGQFLMPRQRVPVLLQRSNVISLRLLNLLRLLRHILSRLYSENDLMARTAKRKDKHEHAKQEHPQRPKSEYRQSCQEEGHHETIPQGPLDALFVCSVFIESSALGKSGVRLDAKCSGDVSSPRPRLIVPLGWATCRY
jgi:hypothetical protein